MSANSNIAWTHHTWNPWIGCTKVSPACDHCYAEEWAGRYAKDVTWGKPGQHAKLRRTKTWGDPLKWNRAAQKHIDMFGGKRQRVFTASLGDIADADAPQDWCDEVADIVEATPALDYLFLSKRPQNYAKKYPRWSSGVPSNVWLGTTVENQGEAVRRIPHLLSIPAPVHFLSCEPLLEKLDITEWIWGGDAPCAGCPMDADCECGFKTRRELGLPSIDWVIIGGESGRNFRHMHMDWVADLRVQCRNANVPVFFKQDSSIKPGSKGRASPELWNTKQFPVSP